MTLVYEMVKEKCMEGSARLRDNDSNVQSSRLNYKYLKMTEKLPKCREFYEPHMWLVCKSEIAVNLF